ncbi:expressed unknown protein [Seminavis robusta]|uniref:Uncharacterized protein n=1 Tax=Seminavis robusta TaxID=568900 RepID=A0A9N8EPK6_9STRA|nr:expressed unknown protein [Seminavis robusta]|eukprot:Sro1605_g285450.1 n/a (316) ;mRNA; f:21509-22625
MTRLLLCIKTDVDDTLARVKRIETAVATPGARRLWKEEENSNDSNNEQTLQIAVPLGVGFMGHDGNYRVEDRSFHDEEVALAFLRDTLRVQRGFSSSNTADLALSVVERTQCALVVNAIPVHSGTDEQRPENAAKFRLNVWQERAQLKCGFAATTTSEDKKTLFVAEGEKKIDTGVYFELEDPCIDFSFVEVDVYSNEFEERNPVITGKAAGHKFEKAKVFVSPQKCMNGGESLCVADSSGTRIYDISFSATESEGSALHDSCRVVVLEKDQYNRALKGHLAPHLSEAKQQELEDSSSEKFVVGSIKLCRSKHPK